VEGRVYEELLDCAPGMLDVGRGSKARGLFFKERVMALCCSKNYFHWLLKMLPRLDLMERSGVSLDEFEAFLVCRPTWQQEEVYRRMKIWDRCVVIDRKTFAVCRLLAAPTICHDAPGWACRYIREKLGPAVARGKGRRIYVTRSSASQRLVVNEEEVCALLASFGFEAVECSGLSIAEQAELFAGSAMVAGAHGAGLSNLVFCEPGTVVLEIFGSPRNQKCYWLISHHMNLEYHHLMARAAEASGAAPEASGADNRANLIIDPGLLRGCMEGILRERGAGWVIPGGGPGRGL